MAITPAAVPHWSAAAPRREALLNLMAFGGSALLHAVALTVACAALSSAPAFPLAAMPDRVQVRTPVLTRLIFLAPRDAGSARGGGGGGNRQAGPTRRAEGVGRDRATLLTRQSVATTGRLPQDEVRPPAVLLDARPIASGNTFQAGLPTSGVTFGFSLGTGSGGGVGTGAGIGIGPGRGPGFGAGSGGGTGNGPYRPGGSVSSPRVLVHVEPRYTSEALERRIQGEVWLRLVVTQSGAPTDVRVVRTLDASLDEEAIRAVQAWRFAPGMLAGSPVDVEVVVIMDFRIY
jgi:TonB family protein